MSKLLAGTIGILVAGLIALTGCKGGRGYASQCPCGFTFSSSANGCIVDIWNLNPCPDSGGGSSGGPRGSGGQSGGGREGVTVGTGGCSLVAWGCGFTPDFRQGTFNLAKFDGGSVAGEKVRVTIDVREQSSGKGCALINGTTAFPSGPKTMTIPLDAGALGAYPGLIANTLPNCVGSQFTINAIPQGRPDCGCKTTLFKP